MSKTVLISGANGYFGGIACRYFRESGWNVLKATRHLDADIPFNLDKPDEFASKTSPVHIDLLIHAAAANEVECLRMPYKSIFYNIAGTKAALDFCAKNEVETFVYLSTFHVYGKPSGRITEFTEPTPVNDYGLSHLQAEQYVRMYEAEKSIRGIVLRPTNFFGIPADIDSCNRWTLVVLSFCKEAVETGRIILRTPGYQKRNFVAVDDICVAIEKLSGVSNGPLLLHLFGRDTLTIRDLAMLVKQRVNKTLGKDVTLIIPEGIPFDDDFEFSSVHTDVWQHAYTHIVDFIDLFCVKLASLKGNAIL